MARGLAQRARPCAEHAHRAAVDHCDACGRLFCAHCFVRGGAKLLCKSCWAGAPSLAAEAARRRHWWYRAWLALRENRASLVAALVIAAVVGTVGGLSVRQAASPEFWGQIGGAARRVAGASGVTGSSTTTAPTESPPGRVATLLRSVLPPVGPPGDNLNALVDGRVGDDVMAWRSAGSTLPIDLSFDPGAPVLAARVLFAHSNTVPPESWAKEVEVWFSRTTEETDMARAGRWTLAQTTTPQEFEFARTGVRTVRLRLLSNYGSSDFTSLAEFALLPPKG